MESSTSSQLKPVVVRVKRRLSHAPLDAFWLEINEKPLKRACLDFAKLTISEPVQSDKIPTKIFVQHIDTVSNAEVTKEAVESFILPNSTERMDVRRRLVEARHFIQQRKMERSTSSQLKPVVVRVKRRLSHAPLDAFWLEINEKPLKRACLDFAKLTVSEPVQSDKIPTKIFVQHIDTVSNAEVTKEAVESFIWPNSTKRMDVRRRLVGERHFIKQGKEILRNARFQQLWKSRRRNDEGRDSSFFKEFCHLYDVVRVDENVEESSSAPYEYENASLDGYEDILCNFLPLIREHIPEAAAEFESDISAANENDGYVYDLYTIGNEISTAVEDVLEEYPLVEVELEDDFYDGPDKTDYDSSDSNDEDNPGNDYPDEDEIYSSENECPCSGSSQATDNESYLFEEETHDDSQEDNHRWSWQMVM